MSFKLIGAILIICGCGGFGISMVLTEKKQEHLVGKLLKALNYMKWELSYRLTPLPELLSGAGNQAGGEVKVILTAVSAELSRQILPDAGSCMSHVLENHRDLPREIRRLFRNLGKSLGNYDLPGQLEGLSQVEESCQAFLSQLEKGKALRRRNYETLGFCTGAALAILFI